MRRSGVGVLVGLGVILVSLLSYQQPFDLTALRASLMRPLHAWVDSGAGRSEGRSASKAQPSARAVGDVVGRVVAVADGDTLTVLTDAGQQLRIRLAEIDTPETAQPYGPRARRELTDLAFGKEVRVAVQDTDRYGRTVGRVRARGQDINAELVRRGAAWVYRQYSHDAALLTLEAEARAARRGLWALPESQRVPPWEWRAVGREENGPSMAQAILPTVRSWLTSLFRGDPGRPAVGSASGFTCGTKRFCREMTSCAEARFYVKQCGASWLDSDHDGRPCEQLCQ